MKSGKQDVSAYIAAASPKARPMLRELRRIIKVAAPKAEERLSYQMPYYHYDGRLAYFSAFTHHVSFFVMARAKKLFAREMKPYQTSSSTLRFPLGTKIPATLIRKLVKARVQELEATRK